MKKLLFLLTLTTVFVLAGCMSVDNYESRLEDEGWSVETTTVEDLPSLIDSEEFEERYNISGILYASKDGITNFGFIIEFTSTSDAQEAYEELVDEDDDEHGDYIRQTGAFLFIGGSSEFLEDLGVE